MSFTEILEIADSVKRTSHRVKNSGDVALAELGLRVARKVKKQPTIIHAKTIEKEYLWILKEKYFPFLPQDKILPRITSMAGYDDSLPDNPNSTVEGTTDIETPNSNETDNNTETNNPEPPPGTYITVVENLANHTVLSTNDADHYTPKEGEHITVTTELEDKIKSISNDFFEVTGKPIVVTDGLREPDDQASAMFNKLENGENLNSLYKNHDAVNEIVNVYNEGKNNGVSDSQIKENITNTINQQIDDNILISKHLSEQAFDVRSRDMTEEQRTAFEQAVEKYGGKVIVEGDHLHVQFNK